YSYWDYGRVAAIHHGNPYADRPSRFPRDPAYRRMGRDCQHKPSVYGPVFTLGSEGVAHAAGDSPRAATRAFRIAAALAMGAVAASIRYGPHWLGVLSPVANQLHSTSPLGLPYWAGKLGFPERYATDGLLLAFALFYLWLLWEAWRGRARLGLAACGLLLATSWLQPWYAVWAVPLAAGEEDTLARLAALALSAYLLRDALPI